MHITEEMRNETFSELVSRLQAQSEAREDLVVPAGALTAAGGDILIAGSHPVITEDGVSIRDGRYELRKGAVRDLAEKLGIPPRFAQQLKDARSSVFDHTVNSLLHGSDGAEPDTRTWLVRAFRHDHDAVVRAILSDRYGIIDNLDCLTAALSGVQQSGAQVEIDSCDLTDDKMVVRVKCATVSELAPELLAGYRSPFSGASGTDNPTVFAGFQICNSETGGGAFTIVPRLIVEVCNNGMTMKRDALRSVHLGEKLDEGKIKWSEATQRKQLDLITSRTRDAVATFLDIEYMRKTIRELTEKAAHRIDPAAAPQVVERVGKRLMFSKETTAGVLGAFIAGGQITAGGVMHAITAHAQTINDADLALAVEESAVRGMELAATI